MSNRLVLLQFLSVLLVCFLPGCRNKQPELFVFEPDERLFAAFAFMNAAGFDGEWREEGMHPIRKEIREYVTSKLDSSFQKQIRQFHFSHHRGSWSGYGPYALLTDKPPGFRIDYDPLSSKGGEEIETDYLGLSELLAEFYEKARIEELWQKYRPLLQAENEKYRPFALKALDEIIKYCRADQDFYLRKARKIHFTICPQMSYFTAQTTEVNGDIYIIHGPSDGEPGQSVFYHEALHHLIDPLTEKYLEIADQSEELSPISKEKGSLGYNEWKDVVLEGRLYKWNHGPCKGPHGGDLLLQWSGSEHGADDLETLPQHQVHGDLGADGASEPGATVVELLGQHHLPQLREGPALEFQKIHPAAQGPSPIVPAVPNLMSIK